MSESNGKTDTTETTTLVAVTDTDKNTGEPAPERYRPKASTDKVRDVVMTSLSRVVTEATYQAGTFVDLADHYDQDKGTAVRLGHLVDATECLEIALTHLSQLKAAMSYRLRIEDDQNTGNPGF